jgi:hypothetical protein
VRAHQNLTELAADMLLYDRVILPRPAGAAEEQRFEEAGWDPASLAAVEARAPDSVYTVLWSDELRDSWQREMAAISTGADAPYATTSHILAHTVAGQDAIFSALASETPLERRPLLIAGYQSFEEANAELALTLPTDDRPLDTTPAQHALAIEISRIVEEPAIDDPEERFIASADLAASERFVKARGDLLAFVDSIALGHSTTDAKEQLSQLESDYNAAVRDFAEHTWRRRAALLLPTLGGAGAGVLAAHAFDPLIGKAAAPATTWAVRKVAGRFGNEADPDETHPGRALAAMRAAYRDHEPGGEPP